MRGAPSPRGEAVTLVERESELTAIETALRTAAEGRGACLVIEGPPGIGKSALSTAAQHRARELGWTVASARASALEHDFPYGVARQLLERATQLAGLAHPATGTDTRTASNFAINHSLYWQVCALADQRPVLLCVDDLHLCDLPSLEFLVHLARRLDGVRVLVVATVRAERELAEVSELLAVDEVRLLEPALLSRDAVAAMVRGRHHALASDGFLDACWRATGGNAFLLTELLLDITARGVGHDDDAVADITAQSPRSVSRSVLLRLAEVGSQARALARAVAILGADVPVHLAARLAGVEAGDVSALCDQLARIGVLADERPLRFVHPLLAEAVLGDLGGGKRADDHRRAALLLAEQGTSAERIAAHLLHTERLGDAWTSDTLRAAARSAAARGATDSARRLLTRALDEGASPADPHLHRELGEAAWLTGDAAAAVQHLNAALTRADDGDEHARSAIVVARVHVSVLDVARATEVLGAAAARDGLEAAMRLRVHTELAMCALLSGANPTSVRAGLEAVLSDPGTDSDALLSAYCGLAATCLFDSDAATTLGYARAGLDRGQLFDAESGESFPVMAALTALSLSDDLDESEHYFELAQRIARERGSTVAFAHVCGAQAVAAWVRGDLRRCEQMAREAIEPGFATSYVQPILYSLVALVAIERGELAEAEQSLELGTPAGPEALHAQSTHRTYARARLERALGRPADAVALLRDFGARAEWEVNRFPFPPWRLELAECLADLGDHDAARAAVDEHLADARRWGTATAIGAALRVQARLVASTDRVQALQRACDVLSASPARLEQARALVDLAAALRETGDADAAVQAARAGYDLAGALNASALAGHARAALLSLGIRPRRRRTSGVDALTARELRVCELASAGLSNSEIAQTLFVTRSTVEKHLSRVYTKLAITSRDQLLAALSAG